MGVVGVDGWEFVEDMEMDFVSWALLRGLVLVLLFTTCIDVLLFVDITAMDT